MRTAGTGPTRERIDAELRAATPHEAAAYLAGASRDGYLNRQHHTLRIAQHEVSWLQSLRDLFAKLGKRSWIYQEGRRDVFVIESTWRGSTSVDFGWEVEEKLAFARGYFDAEGGIPARSSARMYIQLVQKNRDDLESLRRLYVDLGVRCGRLHNPSVAVDPDYWRFYVSTGSHRVFGQTIGSWHPRKRELLRDRGLSD